MDANATLAPRESVFLDSSSTAYFVAQRILDEGLEATVITNSLPIMDLVGTSASPTTSPPTAPTSTVGRSTNSLR